MCTENAHHLSITPNSSPQNVSPFSQPFPLVAASLLIFLCTITILCSCYLVPLCIFRMCLLFISTVVYLPSSCLFFRPSYDLHVSFLFLSTTSIILTSMHILLLSQVYIYVAYEFILCVAAAKKYQGIPALKWEV